MRAAALIFVILVICAASGRNASAEACACARFATPCSGFANAAAVFTGRVESITRTQGVHAVTFRVLDSFRGTSGDIVIVLTGDTGPQCAFPFRVGREYFVYAARTAATSSQPSSEAAAKAALTTSRCSRTREIEDAAADLTFARDREAGRAPPGRISGQVLLGRRGAGGSSIGPPAPLPNIRVRITRNGSSEETVTNQAGDFAFDRREPGVHVVRVDVPDRYYSEDPQTRVELRDAHSCHEILATLHDNGRVSGRMIDASGRPVVGLTVELTTSNGGRVARAITDRNGRYWMSRVAPGRFHVAVNGGSGLSSEVIHPQILYPRILHPGVDSPLRATRVVVAPGELVTLDDFRIPADVRYVSIAGVVFDGDGAPAEGARVFLKGAEDEDVILAEPAIADASGRFLIAALAGQAYRLFAERPRSVGRAGGVDSTDQMPVTAVEGMKPLRLILRRRY